MSEETAAPPPALPAPIDEVSALSRLSEPAETLLKQKDEAPSFLIRVRKDLQKLPEEAQMAWLETYYMAKAWAEAHPDHPDRDPIALAWQEVSSTFDSSQGWSRREAMDKRWQELAASNHHEGGHAIFLFHPKVRAIIASLPAGRQKVAEYLIEGWAKDEIARLGNLLRSSTDEKQTKIIRDTLGNLPSTMAADQRVTDLIKTAKEGIDMPMKATVEFDSKEGNWRVLHANMLKPLTFKDRKAAEDMAKVLDGTTLPKVEKTGDSFKVEHPDWPAAVAARTASEAEEIVGKKLEELGDPKDAAAAQAKTIVSQAAEAGLVHDAPAAGADVGLPPEVLTSIQTIATLLGMSEEKLRSTIKELNEEKGEHHVDAAQRVQADISQNKGEIKGFPNTDVSAPAGKHPVVPGLVKTEGMPIPTIDTSKPGEHLKSDAPTKDDPDKRAVDAAGGLTRKNEHVLMAAADKFDVEAARSASVSRIMAVASTLSPASLEALETLVKQAASEEAQTWISNKIELLRKEGKDADQAAAIAYSMAREKGYEVPEKK